MDAVTAVLDEGSVFAPHLLGALWRAGINGVLFAALVWGISRLIPRLPASTRFWLWWMVSAKLLMGLALGASILPVHSPFVLRLPAQHPAAAPAFFVARLAVQPTRLLYSGGRSTSPSPANPGAKTAPVDSAQTPDAAQTRNEADPLYAANTADISSVKTRTSIPYRLAQPWLLVTFVTAVLWCVGFLWRLTLIAGGIVSARRVLRAATSIPESVQQEARAVARQIGIRRLPRIAMHTSVASPFLVGFLRPVIVLPDPSQTLLSTAELQMALAHELTHLRRGDLWLALIPSLAEAAFFFLPVARWASRECTICREEICDSAAVSSLGSSLLTDYGHLLLKVTLAAQNSRHPAPQMGMAVTVSPAFIQLRRRLNALKNTIHSPVSLPLRRAATLLLAVCLPGMLPWHLRALPRSMALDQEAARDTATELPEYTVIDMGTLGGQFSDAYSVSEDGVVAGTANVFPLGGRGHAFLWRPGIEAPDGEMTDICAGSIYRHSLAYSVNNHGQVAAVAFNNPLKPSAFLWMPGETQRRYLGSLPGFRYSRATGINNNGVVVGAALSSYVDKRGATPMRAFSWQDGRMQDLGTLGGGFSCAVAISDTGHIVGKSDTSFQDSRQTHAVLWQPDNTKPHDIGTLPGGSNSAASAVNRQGNVVGFSENADAARRAFLYTGSTLEDLGALPVSDYGTTPISAAGGINDEGWIVGSSSASPLHTDKTSHPKLSASRAVVWVPVGGHQTRRRLIDLNTCLVSSDRWILESARAINNQGEIVGVGRIHGKRHAFLLRPVNSNDRPLNNRG